MKKEVVVTLQWSLCEDSVRQCVGTPAPHLAHGQRSVTVVRRFFSLTSQCSHSGPGSMSVAGRMPGVAASLGLRPQAVHPPSPPRVGRGSEDHRAPGLFPLFFLIMPSLSAIVSVPKCSRRSAALGRHRKASLWSPNSVTAPMKTHRDNGL